MQQRESILSRVDVGHRQVGRSEDEGHDIVAARRYRSTGAGHTRLAFGQRGWVGGAGRQITLTNLAAWTNLRPHLRRHMHPCQAAATGSVRWTPALEQSRPAALVKSAVAGQAESKNQGDKGWSRPL